MHVVDLVPVSLCLVTLLSLGQRVQFERHRLPHIQMVNKTSNLKNIDL